MKKKILFLALSLIVMLGLVGCVAKEKKFEKDDFKITLTDEFKEDSYKGFNYYFESKKAGLTALKEKFEDLEQINLGSESTLEDYANTILEVNNKDAELKKEDDFYYFTYDSTIDGTKYYYLSTVKKGQDGFWLINFFGRYNDYKTLEPEFIKYAKSIVVK